MPAAGSVAAIKARLQTLTGPARGGGTRQMAGLLDEDFHNVNRWVRGKAAPPHDFLLKVAETYGHSLEWLYGRDTSTPIQPDEGQPAWARRLEARIGRLERMVEETKKAAPPMWAERSVALVSLLAAEAGISDEQIRSESDRLAAAASESLLSRVRDDG